MASESPKKKLTFLIVALIWAVFFGTCGSFYLARMVNANNIDNAYCGEYMARTATEQGICDDYNDKFYDNSY